MSQPRIHKGVSSGANMPRTRVSAAKASGDSMACTIPHPTVPQSRSKNKLPKSVRYDLENALVGLCDVWFEEIKPHLVRNNIKLHVNGSSASGDHERPPAACLAGAAPPEPPALRCSHLDPGAAFDPARQAASCAGSLSTPPTASRSRCPRLLTPSRRPLSPLLSVPPTPRNCPQSLNCEEKQPERPRIRRKHRRFRRQSQPRWRVPRLCRTHTVLCQAGTGSRPQMTASHQPPQPPLDDYYRFIVPRRESVVKNKTTQTEQALSNSRGCQSRSSSSRGPAPRNPAPRNPAPRNPAPRSSASRNPNRSRPDCASPPPIVPPPVICRLKRSETTVIELPPLLQDDLIEIIAESNEKRLKLLYSCSKTDDYPSFMNLCPNGPQEKRCRKKLPPWR